ncbi:MAG: hypothetical protein ACI9J3_003952 [Parvicellaceae bacterium]|jgi:hypothetical protein
MRTTLATIFGVIFAFIIVGAIESISMTIYPPDPAVNWRDPAQVQANWDLIEIPAMIMVFMAHFLSIIGGTIIAKLISRGSKIPGYVIGGLVLLATVMNIIYIHPPLWNSTTDVVLVLIAFWFGLKISKRRGKKPPITDKTVIDQTQSRT